MQTQMRTRGLHSYCVFAVLNVESLHTITLVLIQERHPESRAQLAQASLIRLLRLMIAIAYN